MLTIQDILQKADELILEVQENSITPPRVGELIYGLAELIQQGASGGTTIGIRKLSELEDVELAGLKNLNILQLLGEKWRNVEFDIVKLQAMAGYFNLDDDDNLFTTYNLYSTKEISAFGAGTGSGGSGTSFSRLDAWSLYTNDKSGWVLSALLGKELHDRVLVLEAGGGGIGTEIDPTVAAHIKNITTGDITNWATAYAKSHEHDNISILNATTASFLTADRNKLDGIAAGAQVNVQANWDAASGPAAILNKPYALPASDVYAWAKAATKPTYNASEIGGLGASYRWLTDAYISTWNAKEPAITKGTTSQYFRGDMSLALFPTALPASDVYAWAKAATKPSYNFSEIASKPNTLSGYGITDGLSISIYTAHKNNQDAEKHVTADNLDVLSHLSIVNGALQVDIDFYSTGGVSAYGAGTGSGGSGGLIQTVYGYSSLGSTFNNTTLTDTFNAYTINKINTDLSSRINSLEAGSALNFTTTGSGNVVTSVTKSGTSVTVTKGLTSVLEGDVRLTNDRPNPYSLTFSGYSTATYNGSAAVSVALPTKLSQLTNDSGYLNSIDADLVAIAALTGTTGLLRKTAANTWSLDTNAYLTAITKAQVEGVLTGNITTHIHSQYLTGNQTISVSGDATGSGTTSIALTLANSGVTAGTYKSVTVDVKGRVTAGTNPTTLAGYGITDALLASAYTAADVLTKLKTVDGHSSGLDADTVDGKHVTTSGWWDKLAYIGADGVMEFGAHIDFHETNTGTADYSARLSSLSGSPLWSGNAMYHSGNSNRTDVNWAAATLTAQTDILTPFNTWSNATDKNSMKKFLNLFDIDTAGNLVVKTNLYSTGEVTAYSTGTGVSGLTLMGDMNANNKTINNVLNINAQQVKSSKISAGALQIGNNPTGDFPDCVGLFGYRDDEVATYLNLIATYKENTGEYIYANNLFVVDSAGQAAATSFKFGNWTFKQDASGRLGIYNGATEVACFNTDGTYVNL